MTTVMFAKGDVSVIKIVGARLRELRKEQRHSQASLGELADVDPSYISMLEREVKDNPSLAIVGRLADALGTSIEYLTGTTDDPGTPRLKEVALHHIDRRSDPSAPIPERLRDRIRWLQDELGRLADELDELDDAD